MAEHTGESRRVVIAGAGLAGALMACCLGRAGHRVALYERRPDPRAKGFIGGRSINLALSTRGITALEIVGLAKSVLADAIPMRGRMIHDTHGRLTFQPYSKNSDDAINSISRGGLNLTLIEAAAAIPGVEVHFDQRCEDVDLDGPAALFIHEQTGERTTVDGDLIIGADGAFSAVRGRLQKQDRFDYSQDYLSHGYKELTIPPGSDGDFALEPHALHIWPRPQASGGFMMIVLPNIDRSFTCTCFWPFRGPTGFEAVELAEDVRPFFEKHFPDAALLMPTLVEDFMANPTSSLVTIRCGPWHWRDKVIILGDAAHAIVPFYGQGMNAAFEDCRILDELLRVHADDWGEALQMFYERRKPDAEAIADLALENFIEMRDKVASRAFLMKKRIEKLVHRLLPGWFTPLYNLVSFTNVPYAEARATARRQWGIVKGAGVSIVFLVAVLLIVMLSLMWKWSTGSRVPVNERSVSQAEVHPPPQTVAPATVNEGCHGQGRRFGRLCPCDRGLGRRA